MRVIFSSDRDSDETSKWQMRAIFSSDRDSDETSKCQMRVIFPSDRMSQVGLRTVLNALCLQLMSTCTRKVILQGSDQKQGLIFSDSTKVYTPYTTDLHVWRSCRVKMKFVPVMSCVSATSHVHIYCFILCVLLFEPQGLSPHIVECVLSITRSGHVCGPVLHSPTRVRAARFML